MAGIPQVITEDRASGAQVIEGSLKFDSGSSHYLNRTPSSTGNRRTWTWSSWVKFANIDKNDQVLFSAVTGSSYIHFRFMGVDSTNSRSHKLNFQMYDGSTSWNVYTRRVLRDSGSWYHLLLQVDYTQATAADRTKIYINGELTDQVGVSNSDSATFATQNYETYANLSGAVNNIGYHSTYGEYFDGEISNVYLIDGQALEPTEFGFTDPLTNTWRPKKYEGTFGTNGFWLPMDGNTPIGKDQSGNGNDFTPVNFGGSNTIEKATGALPILNTDGGGKTAKPGTRNDAYASDIVMAIPFLDNVNDISADIRGSGSNLSVTTSGSPAADSDPTQWYGSSFNVSTGNYIDTIGTTTTFAFLHQPEAAGTVEGWINTNAINVQGPWFQTSNGTGHVGVMFRQNSSTNLAVQINRGVSGQAIVIDSSVTVGHNRWYHWAFVKSADGYAQFFLNGVPTGSKVPISTAAGASNAASTNTSSSFAGRIAKNNGESRGVGANISDYRAYTIQKYAFDTPFIPASTNPDILPDTPSGITGKTNLTKITDGAVAFDGTGDYLRIPNSSDFSFGSGDFCVEGFVYYTETSGNGTIAGLWNSGSNRRSWLLQIESDVRRLRGFYSLNGSSTVQVNGTTGIMQRNSWNHVALTRNGNNIRLFLNGIQIGSATESGSFYDNSDDDIGVGSAQGGSASDPITGFLSNVRIVKGSAVYTSNFTPPTEPLTEVTNTKLLCCQSTTSAVAAAVGPGTFVNDGTNYSSGSQVTGSAGLTNVDSIFDGHLRLSGNPSLNEGATVNVSSDNYILWTPTTGISYTSKVEVYCYAANGYEITNYYTFNGGTETTFTGGASNFNGNAWITVATGSGTINSIKIRITRGSGNQSQVNWYAVRVDGTILINDYNGKSIGKYDNTSATTFNPFTDDINTIRGQETGYATFNPLLKGANTTLSNGNMTVSSSGGTFSGFATGTILIPKTGKWFVEFTAGSLPSSTYYGMYNTRTWNPNGFGGTGFFGLQADTGRKFKSTGQSDYGSAVSVGDVVGVMYDADNNTIGFMNNGINYGVAFDSSDGIDYTDDHRLWWNTNGATSVAHTINFGQKPFKFPPPDGFQPLSLSTVQSDKVFARPDHYIGATLYTGTGGAVSPRTVELPLAADLVWAKSRDRTSYHMLVDTVRGNNKVLSSNANDLERDPTSYFSGGGVASIDGKIISIESGSSNNANLNTSGEDAVVWSWKAGGSSNTFNVDDVGYANASDVNMNVGALNSAQFLKGQVWSGLMSVASGSFDQAASRAFDGFLRTDPNRLRTSDNQATVTMNLSSAPVTVSSQIKVHAEPGYNSSCTVTVGGVTHTSSTGALHTFNVSGSLTQMTLQSTQSGGRTYMEGMEIDGKLLVDDNITVNAPSIAPTGCSVGTKQGFSIIKYDATGSNLRVSHGLSERPGFILLKTVHSTSGDWLVWHQSLAGVDRFLKLNDTITQAQADNVFLSIDENTFGTGDDSGINSNGQQKIAYLWHDVPGLQKFGKWTNNNSNDGTFIELGFKPALILLKNTDNVEKWYWIDSSRHPHNLVAPSNTAAGAVNTLQPNTSNTEASSRNSHTNTTVDILSNGFKIRTTNPASGEISFGTRNYIYAAWAEVPGANLYGGQANGR